MYAKVVCFFLWKLPIRRYKQDIKPPVRASISPVRACRLNWEKTLLSLVAISTVPMKDIAMLKAIEGGSFVFRIKKDIIPKKIGLVVTNTTLLATEVSLSEINHNIK